MASDRADWQPAGCSPGTKGDDTAAHSSRDRVPRVLLVDDDDLNRALVRTALARSADPLLRTALLLEAADLADAHAVLAAGPVDIVLLDIRLPDGNGLELAAQLQRPGRQDSPTVIALTGAMDPAVRGAAMSAGCAAVLGKPYCVASLCELITAELRRRATQHEHGAARPADITANH
jgi:CheY-like chemotaxis protein